MANLVETSTKLEEYLPAANTVPGWLHPFSARFIADLSILQQTHNLHGSLGEIGVHMGRLFIVLQLTRASDERCFAIDVFQHQHLNPDRSGWGNRAVFLHNVAKWSGSADGIVIFEQSSQSIRPHDILKSCGRCRLLSIDGGHTAECTFDDLRLAEAIMYDHGVVILDDFFNPHWPGVATGASRYFQKWRTNLKPFAITPNKLYLARTTQHEAYRARIREKYTSSLERTTAMFGNQVDIYGCAGAVRALTELDSPQVLN